MSEGADCKNVSFIFKRTPNPSIIRADNPIADRMHKTGEK